MLYCRSAEIVGDKHFPIPSKTLLLWGSFLSKEDWPGWVFGSWEGSYMSVPDMHKPAWSLWCWSDADQLPYRQATSQVLLHHLRRPGLSVRVIQYPLFSSTANLWLTSPVGSPPVGFMGWPEEWSPYPRELEWKGTRETLENFPVLFALRLLKRGRLQL